MRLTDRCEGATEHNRWLDAQIAATLRIGTEHSWAYNFPEWIGRADGRVYLGDNGPSFAAPYYTASLDAAMTLVPEGWSILFAWNGQRCVADVHTAPIGTEGDWPAHATAATPALALCAAALRARA